MTFPQPQPQEDVWYDQYGNPLWIPNGWTWTGTGWAVDPYWVAIDQPKTAVDPQMMGGVAPQAQARTDMGPQWDYKAPPLNEQGIAINKDGMTLPEGATGFDPLGEPYWGNGDGFINWGQKFLWNLYGKPVKLYQEEKVPTAAEAGAVGKATGAYPGVMLDMPDLKVPYVWSEEKPNFLTILTTRVPAVPMQILFAGLQLGVDYLKHVVGAGEAFEAVAEMYGTPLPSTNIGEKLEGANIKLPELPGGTFLQDKLKRLESVVEDAYSIVLKPLTTTYQFLRYLTADAPLDVKKQDFQQYYEGAKRIPYTMIIEPMVREEIKSRTQAGENPYLLAMELKNPVAEAWGEFVYDPLNYIGYFTGPLLKSAKLIGASKFMVNYSDELVDIEKTMGAVGDINNEAKAAEAVKAVQLATDARYTRLTSKLDDLPRVKNLFSLTQEAKSAQMTQWMGTYANGLLRSFKTAGGADIDDMLETMEALVHVMGTTEERGEALRVLQHSKISMPMLLSDAGGYFGIFMRRMMDDGEGGMDAVKFLTKMVEECKDPKTNLLDLEKLIDFATGRINKAVDEAFPTLLDLSKNAEKLKFLEEGGQELTALEMKVVQRASQIQPTVKGLAAIDNAIRTNKAYRGLQTFFSTVYFGVNPGFAARNYIQNAFHVWVDWGPGAGMEAIAAGLPSFVFRRGVVAEQAAKDVRAILGYVPSDMFKKISGGTIAAAEEGAKLGEKISIFNFSAQAANIAESSMGAVVFRVGVMRVFEKMGPKAMPAFDAMKATGLSDEGVEALKALFMRNYGNMDKVKAQFLEVVGEQGLQRWKVLELWMHPDDIKALKQMPGTIWQDIQKAVQSDTVEKFQTSMASVMDDLIKRGARVKKEGIVVSSEDTAVQLISDRIREAVKTGALTEEQATKVQWQIASSHQAMDSIEIAIHDAAANIHAELLTKIYQKAVDAEADMSKLFNKSITALSKLNASETKRTDDILEGIWQISHELTSLKGRGTNQQWNKVMEVWDKTRLSFLGLKKPVRADLAGATVGDWLWEFCYRESLGSWDKARVSAAAILQDFVRDSQKVVDGVGGTIKVNDIPLVKQAWGTLDQAEQVSEGNPIKFADGSVVMQRAVEAAPTEVPEDVLKLNLQPELPLTEDELLKSPTILAPPYTAGTMPSDSRYFWESKAGLQDAIGRISEQWANEFGKTDMVISNKTLEGKFAAWVSEAEKNMASVRLAMAQGGTEARNFTLLNYQNRRYIDSALSYIYPWQFWYSRTYTNWMQRVAQDPAVITGYAKYRRMMESLHADQPDWWKYNVNTDELLGIETKHPWFFNLEATLNPLNGLTGVDFNDPYKRTNWFTSMIDDMGKFGPSPFPLFGMAVGMALFAQGKQDAGARWAGRLFPQTQYIKAATGMLGKPIETDPFTWLFSGGIDPYERRRVGRALGGMIGNSSYTEAQVMDAAQYQQGPVWDEAQVRAWKNRGLGQMGSFLFGMGFKSRTKEDLQVDNFYNEYNFLWQNEPNLSPQELRLGLETLKQKYPFMDALLLSKKAGADRDRSWAYNVLARIPPGQRDEFAKQAGVDPKLFQRFYDDKGDIESWAPSDRNSFTAAMLALGARLEVPDDATRAEWTQASNAYTTMNDTAKKQFGANILDLTEEFYRLNGKTPKERLNAQNYLAENPQIEQYMQWRKETILADDLLNAYYGGLNVFQEYRTTKMWNDLELKYGKDIWDKNDLYWQMKELNVGEEFLKRYPQIVTYQKVRGMFQDVIDQVNLQKKDYLLQNYPGLNAVWLEYNRLKIYGAKGEATAFYKQHGELAASNADIAKFTLQIDKIELQRDQLIQANFPGIDIILAAYSKAKSVRPAEDYLASHPELQQYWDERDFYKAKVFQDILDFAKMLPEMPQAIPAELRPGTPQSVAGENIQAAAVPQQQLPSWSDWQMVLPESLQVTLISGYQRGGTYSDQTMAYLEQLASKYNVQVEELLSMLEWAMQNQ